MALSPGRLTRAAIQCEAGEAELRLSSAGNWQLAVRSTSDREWRLACAGDLGAGGMTRFAQPEREPIRLGKLLIDFDARRAFVDRTEVRIRKLEFSLLAALASEPTRVFTKQELMRAVWNYDSVPSSRTLETHASRLRVLLRRAGAEGMIVNLPAVGYKLWDVPNEPGYTISHP